ncbi:MAG: hypothetical protein IT371_08500 [Deltaproteobacteria bacterium]|nr:hypothetical protein [Deltaproteobacteria bacterium]
MKRSLPALLLPALIAILSGAATGCADSDTGLPCEASTTGTDTVIITQALDCRSKLCMRYGATGSTPMCTKSCAQDSDCPDATDTCAQGFKCVHSVGVGTLKCCKMCVCRRFISGDTDPLANSCANVSNEKCPSL